MKRAPTVYTLHCRRPPSNPAKIDNTQTLDRYEFCLCLVASTIVFWAVEVEQWLLRRAAARQVDVGRKQLQLCMDNHYGRALKFFESTIIMPISA
jgi:hypothetical protein